MKRRKDNRGQYLLEQALLIALVAAALVGMRVFLARVVQDKFRQSADVFGQGEQYAPGRTEILPILPERPEEK